MAIQDKSFVYVTLTFFFPAIAFSCPAILSIFTIICKSVKVINVLQYDTAPQEINFIINHLGCMLG